MAFNFATSGNPTKKKADFSKNKVKLSPAPSIKGGLTAAGSGTTSIKGGIQAAGNPTGTAAFGSVLGASTSRSIKGGISAAGNPTGRSSNLPSPVYSAPISPPRTISPTSMYASAATAASAPISSTSLASSPSISLPSAPSYSNPGTINNGGLVSALSDQYEYDSQSNTFVKKEQQMDETQRGLDLQNMLQDLMPQKESVYNDPAIRQQNEEVARRRQEVANYTGQLNNVVAQQNVDLLRLRGIGSQEGVTETVYGGQAATINREAAIKALPIQAALAGAQGNLELAQDYLTQLTSWKQEEIDNTFSYKMALFDSIKDFVKGSEKTRLDQLEKEENRSYQEKRDNLNAQDEWAKYAIQNGQPALVSRIHALNPADPTFSQQLATIQSRLIDASNARANENAALDNTYKRAQIANIYSETAARANAQSAGGTPTLTGKPQTQAQILAQGFADRTSQADKIITAVGPQFTGVESYLGNIMPNFLKSSTRQQYEQAQRNFVNAVLRRESGAVISNEEFANARQQYFPQPGDALEVVAQKAQNRNTVVNNLYQSGNTYRPATAGTVIEDENGKQFMVGEDGETLIAI